MLSPLKGRGLSIRLRIRRGRTFVDSQKNARFRSFCSASIVVDAATAGAIAAFFRNEKGSNGQNLDTMSRATR
jgi:hypothetical protein